MVRVENPCFQTGQKGPRCEAREKPTSAGVLEQYVGARWSSATIATPAISRLWQVGLFQRSAVAIFFLILTGCEPVPVQYPPGSSPQSIPYPAPSSASSQSANLPPPGSQPQVSGSQRWQHAWEKAMEGVAMGGSVAGPYGAGGGLVIGLITGLITADSHYDQLNTQIQVERAKDQELEAQIEQELSRQRELEAQLEKPGKPLFPPRRQQAQQATREIEKRTNGMEVEQTKSPVTVASLEKKEGQFPRQGVSFKNAEVKDLNGDGIPELWVYYDPVRPEEIVRQEEDTNGDGRVDTWSAFHNGKLVRREIDGKGDGKPDILYYYKDDKIAREEKDEVGNGLTSFRAMYKDGRVTRVEKDTDGDGNMDLWITYDTTRAEEMVLKEEQDLNGDGVVDLWSYFEAGRLVRRDVSAVGLDHLTAKEKAPELPPLHDASTPTQPKS